MGIAITRERRTDEGTEEITKARQSIVPIAVLFFDAQRAILNTQPAPGIEATVVARAAVEAAEKRTIRRNKPDRSNIGPERRRCDRVLLVRKAGPPALRSDIEGQDRKSTRLNPVTWPSRMP